MGKSHFFGAIRGPEIKLSVPTVDSLHVHTVCRLYKYLLRPAPQGAFTPQLYVGRTLNPKNIIILKTIILYFSFKVPWKKRFFGNHVPIKGSPPSLVVFVGLDTLDFVYLPTVAQPNEYLKSGLCSARPHIPPFSHHAHCGAYLLYTYIWKQDQGRNATLK